MFRSLIVALALCAGAARAEVPDQSARWEAAKINPKDSIRVGKAVALYLRLAPRYEQIERMRANGVPAPVLFCFHQRESDGDFSCHPHEGSPLTHRTRFVPKGRLPGDRDVIGANGLRTAGGSPYTFAESAQDAYYVCDRLDTKDWQHLAPALQAIESFNGLGYQHPGRPPSPYLWAATTIERPGKYVADGRFSPTARDSQLGCVAILKAMLARGIALPFVR